MNKKACITLILGLAISIPGLAQETQPSNKPDTKVRTLADLAERADFIAVVRVEETDYEKTRTVPTKGWALLKVLIPYKGASRGDIIEVTEEGLRDEACYYPEVGAFEFEGQRFLAFLRHVKDETYKGRLPGCMIPVLITSESSYVVRAPIEGIQLPDTAVEQSFEFADPAAFIYRSDIPYEESAKLLEDSYMEEVEEENFVPESRLRYTKGISLQDVRRLINWQSSETR